MIDLLVFLPCYNEELNISDLIEAWIGHTSELSVRGYNLRIYGIDDCSKDFTRQKISMMVEKYGNVSLITHETNKGLSGGLNTAISYFHEKADENSRMVLMDGDNTHDPKYIFKMLETLEKGKDCVIASRYCKESNTVGVALHREFLSDMAKRYYKFVLRVPGVCDYTCGYRIYTYNIIAKLVGKFGSEPVVEKSFACMMELLYKLYLVGAVFGEIGFELRYDYKRGSSKMHVIETMKTSLVTAIKLRKFKDGDSLSLSPDKGERETI